LLFNAAGEAGRSRLVAAGGADAVGEITDLCIVEIEAGVRIKGSELLLIEGNVWRKGRDMPVDMSIRLLAAEAEDVQPVGRHGLADRFADAVNYTL
jgi:hypothetical protein